MIYNGVDNSFITIDTTIKEDAIEEGALDILFIIKPEWKRKNIITKFFTGGITNVLLSCRDGSLEDDLSRKSMLLVRIYGANTEKIINRDAEAANMRLLSREGLGSPLYARFNNGIVYGYVDGCIISERMIKDNRITSLIAKEMASFHNVHLDEEVRATLANKTVLDEMPRFIAMIPDHYEDKEHHIRFTSITSIAALRDEAILLTRELQSLNSPLVYCHNDILLANIIYNKQHDKVCFIDFEYASLNYEAFDIGNHFDEYAGVDDIDYNRYPDKVTQLPWLRTYLQAKNNDIPPSEHQVLVLYAQVNKFALAGHFFWSIWAFIQAANSKIDFDFMGYGISRLTEYYNRKESFLAIEMPK